jgi:hypothetical protein
LWSVRGHVLICGIYWALHNVLRDLKMYDMKMEGTTKIVEMAEYGVLKTHIPMWSIKRLS